MQVSDDAIMPWQMLFIALKNGGFLIALKFPSKLLSHKPKI